MTQAMIIIPTYNERKNLQEIVPAIFAVKDDFQILVVDDNSPDGTGEAADRMAEADDRIHVLHRASKLGLGTAYIEGFRYALDHGMDLILEMDADFSHHPRYLPDMLKALEEADVAIGSRYYEGIRVDGWRFRRLLLSKFANMYASYMIIIPVWDFTAGFVGYRRQVLEHIDLEHIRSDGYAFQIEMKTYAYRAGYKLKEVPILFRERESGESKISRRIVREAFWTVIRLRSPLRDIIRHLRFLFRDYRDFVSRPDDF